MTQPIVDDILFSMNPKEALSRVGKGIVRPFVAYYNWSREQERWMSEDRERMRLSAGESYVRLTVRGEDEIFDMLNSINQLTGPGEMQQFDEEARRYLNGRLDDAIRKMVAISSDEGLVKAHTLRSRKNPEAIRKIRIPAVEASIEYWQQKLAQPDLTINVIYMGRRRLTQLQGEFERLQEEQAQA